MNILTAKDAEAIIATGTGEFRHNRSTQLTPSARDLLAAAGVEIIFDDNAPAPDAQQASKPERRAQLSANEIQKLFNSDEAEQIKQEICDIGKRIWARDYVDGNGGNISYRIGPNQVLCTPTLVSKGFMKPEMICMVDLEGNQLAGTWKRTSEITTHLAIYKGTEQAKAVAHAHPVHATAFAMAGYEPPQCLIPEQEVFVGRVPLAPYRTPGSPAMAEVIEPLAAKHQAILMGNHGIICWGTGVEDAYWKMEIVDAYCRTLVIASHLPSRDTRIPDEELARLLELKKTMGLPDDREGLSPMQLCEVDPWQSLRGVEQPCRPAAANDASAPAKENDQFEQMVQQITDEVMATLS